MNIIMYTEMQLLVSVSWWVYMYIKVVLTILMTMMMLLGVYFVMYTERVDFIIHTFWGKLSLSSLGRSSPA